MNENAIHVAFLGNPTNSITIHDARKRYIVLTREDIKFLIYSLGHHLKDDEEMVKEFNAGMRAEIIEE